MLKNNFIFVLFLFALTLVQIQVQAQTQKQMEQKTQDDNSAFNFNLYVENDTTRIGGPGSDSSYSNGIKLSFLYALNHEPQWTKIFSWFREPYKDRTFNYGLGIGHQIFTPEDLTRTDLITRDRPYAGWFFISPSLNIVSEDYLEIFELNLGMIGPYAFGKEVQKNFHKLIQVAEPQGWDHQLGTEMGFIFSYERKYKFLKTNFFDCIPYFGGSLGNVYDDLVAGSLFRLGYNIPSDFGPARPSNAEGDSAVRIIAPIEKKSWRIYGFAGIKGFLMGRNIFLDGNTFQDSHRVTRMPFVNEYELGVYVQYKMLALAWRSVGRSAEFFENQKSHNFASITLTVGQKF